MKMHECLESPHARLSKDDAEGHPDKLRDLEGEILSRIFEEQRSDSLAAILNRAGRTVAQVRDRLSSDLVRVVNQFSTLARGAGDSAWGYVSVGDALAVLNGCIGTLAALRGIEMEKYDTRTGLALPQHREANRALDPAGEVVSQDHRSLETSDLAVTRDAPRNRRQFDGLPVAILHHSATRARPRSLDERRAKSTVAGLPDEGPLRALPKFVQHAIRGRMADYQTTAS